MKKIALLFGNDNYGGNPYKLDCAINDAKLLSSKLAVLGFDCHCHTDLTVIEMGQHIADFKKAIKDYDVGLFYFAGHGFEDESVNYLTGIDTCMQDEGSMRYTSYKLNEILDIFKNSSLDVKIVILDACRSNLPQGSRGTAVTSFAPISAPVGTIIAFSTSPGQTALEMKDKSNGYYTKSLVENIDKVGIPIEYMFKNVRETLSAYTNKRQISWEHTSLLGNFYFNPLFLNNEFSSLYSKDALEDSLYIVPSNSIFKEIISNLKSYDYNIQQLALYDMSLFNLRQFNREELFILGRNLYQASCGGCFKTQKYIANFRNNSKSYEAEIIFHLLNGMLYEIYFDSKGQLRNQLKTTFCREVLEVVESHNDYSKSLRFIQNALSQHSNQLLYIPGIQNPIELVVNLAENSNEDQHPSERFYVKSIFYQGSSVLYNETGHSLYSRDAFPVSVTDLSSFENSLKKTLGAPSKMVRIKYIPEIDKGSLIETNHNYTMRFNSRI
ncbi:caspase family protein [Proteiniclasticum sp.]|uniref:caspase family protein n=1 Tax=Proteiniclasticum sp. TaxID=2053595 RepID=UPI00289B9187|nr:caspase family protein [Proteiniclasticum sp.]